MKRKRWMAVAGLMAAGGCGSSSPAAPSPPFVGDYSFVVEASSVCQLPVSRFEWAMVGTATGGQGSDYRLTLPGGDPSLSITVGYGQQQGRGNQQSPSFSVSISAQSVPFGETLQVSISGPSRAPQTVPAADGRGQIGAGAINGVIRLAEVGPRGRVEVGSCTAGDHRFTLTPR